MSLERQCCTSNLISSGTPRPSCLMISLVRVGLVLGLLRAKSARTCQESAHLVLDTIRLREEYEVAGTWQFDERRVRESCSETLAAGLPSGGDDVEVAMCLRSGRAVEAPVVQVSEQFRCAAGGCGEKTERGC